MLRSLKIFADYTLNGNNSIYIKVKQDFTLVGLTATYHIIRAIDCQSCKNSILQT